MLRHGLEGAACMGETTPQRWRVKRDRLVGSQIGPTRPVVERATQRPRPRLSWRATVRWRSRVEFAEGKTSSVVATAAVARSDWEYCAPRQAPYQAPGWTEWWSALATSACERAIV